jgi:hypothetical protein
MAHTEVLGETQLPPINVEKLNEAGLDGELIMKVLLIRYHINHDENDKLCTDLTVEQLVNDYGFTQQQLDDLQAIFNGTYVAPRYRVETNRGLANRPLLQAKEAMRIYISNADLTDGAAAILLAAAAAGPDALAAAFTSFSFLLGGPLAGAVSVVSSVMGKAFFYGLASAIMVAVYQGKGLAIYLGGSYPYIHPKVE